MRRGGMGIFLQMERGPGPVLVHYGLCELGTGGIGNSCGNKSFKLVFMFFTIDCSYVTAMALHIEML